MSRKEEMVMNRQEMTSHFFFLYSTHPRASSCHLIIERRKPMNRRTSILTAVVITLLLALPVLAADKPGEGTKFFMNYRAAFQEAKAVEELFPFLSKERISQVEKTPKQDRVKMFELMKMMDMKNVKVTKETETATGYTLEATGEGGMEGGPSKGTIRIVREDRKLKLGEESWKK